MSVPKIFINMDGGIIQQILSSSPVEIIIADFDLDDLDLDRITQFKDETGEDSEAYIVHQEVGSGDNDETEIVDILFKNIKQALKKEEGKNE